MLGHSVRFEHPPIVELVLGVQFTPVNGLLSAHLGKFWESLGEEWLPGDAPPLADQFELFDRPPSPAMLRLQFTAFQGPGRMTFTNPTTDRMVQVQGSRFHLNWKRTEKAPYPTYETLIGEFEAKFDTFKRFIQASGLDSPIPNQWEITYIDAFPQGELWESVDGWSAILPGLFGGLFQGEGLSLEQRRGEWVYEILPKRGRLHVSGALGKTAGDDRQQLLLQMTARGPIGKDGAATIREGLDIGHSASLETFLGIVSPTVRESWREVT